MDKFMKYLIFILLFLGSCKSVKKDIAKSNETFQEMVTQKINEVVKQRIENNKVSKEKKETESVEVSGLKIFPRGEFTIDNLGTFTGKADSVVQVNNKAVKEVLYKSDSITQVKTIEADRTIKNDLDRLITKDTIEKQVQRKPSLIPWIAVGLIFFLILFFIVKVK
jgi:hypothetical protein